MKEYIRISYTIGGKPMTNKLKLSEKHLIINCLRDADENKADIRIVECDESTYKYYFE